MEVKRLVELELKEYLPKNFKNRLSIDNLGALNSFWNLQRIFFRDFQI